MLQKLPERALRLAEEAVLIRADSVTAARCLERLESEARKRASRTVQDARADALRIKEEAALQGYGDGCAMAVLGASDALARMRACEDAWIHSAVTRAKAAVCEALEKSGAEAWLIERLCRQACENSAVWPVLRVPPPQQAWAAQLCTAPGLERLRLQCRDEGPCVLDAGTFVIEFTLKAAACKDVEENLVEESLRESIRELAAQWARSTTNAAWKQWEKRQRWVKT